MTTRRKSWGNFLFKWSGKIKLFWNYGKMFNFITSRVIFPPSWKISFTKIILFGRESRSFVLLMDEKSKFTNEINRKRFDGIFYTLKVPISNNSCVKHHVPRDISRETDREDPISRAFFSLTGLHPESSSSSLWCLKFPRHHYPNRKFRILLYVYEGSLLIQSGSWFELS